MAFQIDWTQRARQVLKAIIDYIAQDNSSAVEKLRIRILARTEVLRGSPRVGQRFDAESDHEVRQLVDGNYRIFYEIDEQHYGFASSRCGMRPDAIRTSDFTSCEQP